MQRIETGARPLFVTPRIEPQVSMAENSALRLSLNEWVERIRSGGRNSDRIARAMIRSEPPAIERGEITDTYYTDQRPVLTHRAALVEALDDERSSSVLSTYA